MADQDSTAQDRWRRVIAMRETERLTFTQIGTQLGVTGARAVQIYKRASQRREHERSDRTISELSVRAQNCLKRIGLDAEAEPIDVAARWSDISNGPRSNSNGGIRNLGKGTVAEILSWLQRHGLNPEAPYANGVATSLDVQGLASDLKWLEDNALGAMTHADQDTCVGAEEMRAAEADYNRAREIFRRLSEIIKA